MTITSKTPFWALAACLSALALAPVGSARADTSLACSSMLAGIADGASSTGDRLTVVKSEKLYRFQARPWARIPEGVALHVKAPKGTTAADIHNAAANCVREGGDTRSPLCIKDASISVTRAGGLYVLRITSDSRSAALEIQRRAESLTR
jgi:hypothetical protein